MSGGMYNHAIETLPLEQLRELQSKRLRDLVKHVYENVSFYQQQFAAIGLHPDDIKSIEDLPKLPFTRKTDLRDHYPFGLFAKPMDQILRIHASPCWSMIRWICCSLRSMRLRQNSSMLRKMTVGWGAWRGWPR